MIREKIDHFSPCALAAAANSRLPYEECKRLVAERLTIVEQAAVAKAFPIEVLYHADPVLNSRLLADLKYKYRNTLQITADGKMIRLTELQQKK